MLKTARDTPRQAFGPTANGRATKPAHHARPPGPYSARDSAELSRPSDLIRRPAATLAGSKPATPVFPETLATLSPSPFSLHANRGSSLGGEGKNRRRRHPLRRRARSPARERAAVERVGGGALSGVPARAESGSVPLADERRSGSIPCAGIPASRVPLMCWRLEPR